jgi:SpoVK/Ycf46/Vps4 family AAA+-type ATPase
LPAELLRKGRFDEIFFVDLPTLRERASVLAIHLTKHHRDPRDSDVARLAQLSEGFSGAELEQAVVSALYAAFGEGTETQLADRHLEAAIGETVPLSQSMGPRITQLRKDAATRWRLASPPETEAAVGALDLSAEPPPVPSRRKRIFDV